MISLASAHTAPASAPEATAAPAPVDLWYRAAMPPTLAERKKFNEGIEVESQSWRLSVSIFASHLTHQVPHLSGLAAYTFGAGPNIPNTSILPLTPTRISTGDPEPLAEPIRCATCGTIPEWPVNQPAVCLDCAAIAETPRAIGEPLGRYEEVGDVVNALERGRLHVDEGAQLVCVGPLIRWGRSAYDPHHGALVAARIIGRRKERICPCYSLDTSDGPLFVYAAEPEPRLWWDWWRMLG